MTIPSITLNPSTIKCLSNIPAGFWIIIDTPGFLLCRPAGTSHCLDYIMTEVGVKLKFLTKRVDGNV